MLKNMILALLLIAIPASGAGKITNPSLASMANGTFKCRNTAGTGDPEDCSTATVKSMLGLGSSAGVGNLSARFVIEGTISPATSINGPHYQYGTQSLTAVNLSCLNSGTTGTTVFQVNQYRSGSLQASATASLSASSSAPAGSAASLSGTLSLLAGDIITVDINSGAPGASDCSLEY